MNEIIAWSFTITMFFLFLILRNEIVYRARMKAINCASVNANEAINNGQDWKPAYAEIEAHGSYHRQIFDLTKWRFRDFYPNFTEKDAWAK